MPFEMTRRHATLSMCEEVLGMSRVSFLLLLRPRLYTPLRVFDVPWLVLGYLDMCAMTISAIAVVFNGGKFQDLGLSKVYRSTPLRRYRGLACRIVSCERTFS